MTAAIVLAAGKGTRMRSELPKVLHPFHGEAMVLRPVRNVLGLGAQPCVLVVGHQAELVKERVTNAFGPKVSYALQEQQNGTGHAVLCALEALGDFEGPVFLISGDVPLLRSQTLEQLREAYRRSSAGLAMLTFVPETNFGYGRILRDGKGRVVGISEQADCDETQAAIRECNAGTYCVEASALRSQLPNLGSNNAQGEIYLTDLVAALAQHGDVLALQVDPDEVAGVNTPEELRALEARAQEA